jgi:hypothetical protein
MMNTVKRFEPSTRTNIKIPAWAFEFLKRKAGEGAGTKGWVAYEVVMLANPEYEDALSKSLNHVKSQFAETIGRQFLDSLENKKFSHVNGKAVLKGKIEDEWDDPEWTGDGTELWLPRDFRSDLPHRPAQTIIDSIRWVASVPWDSRMEMMDDMIDLINFAEDGKYPEDPSEFVAAIITGDNETNPQWDITEFAAVLGEQDLHQMNLTYPQLIDIGTLIKQTPDARSRALSSAANNHSAENEEGTFSPEGLVVTARKAFQCAPTSAEQYAKMASLDRLSFNIRWEVEEIVDSVNEKYSTPNRFGHEPLEHWLPLRNHQYKLEDVVVSSKDEAQEVLDELMLALPLREHKFGSSEREKRYADIHKRMWDLVDEWQPYVWTLKN